MAAKALLEVDDRRTVQRDAERWLNRSSVSGFRDESGEWIWGLELDWEARVTDVDTRGRGWSNTESRLFQLVAALLTGQPLKIVGVLDLMGSWETNVWRILTDWGTGGDNRQRPGRSAAVPRATAGAPQIGCAGCRDNGRSA